jgi:hypothetical protein
VNLAAVFKGHSRNTGVSASPVLSAFGDPAAKTQKTMVCDKKSKTIAAVVAMVYFY